MFTADHAPPLGPDPRPHPQTVPENQRADRGPQEPPRPRIPAPEGDPAKAAWEVCLDWEDAYLDGDEDDYELIRLRTWLVKFADELSRYASAPRRIQVRRLRERKIPFREIALAVGLDEAWVRKFARDADDTVQPK